MHDILIAGGTIIDGSGSAPFVADVAIEDDRIIAIGHDLGAARQTIDARGLHVTPGFVDIHTHYDGQVMWDQRLVPSTDHGVTTVIMGNCAVGIAPCKADQRDLMVQVMAGVEDIPEAVMTEGLPWNWESFPEYLDALEARECDADFAAMLPHGPLRVFVMGQRGADREPASADDLAKMSVIVRQALDAGAIGFSTSRTLIHRALDGRLAPAETASEEELMTIARAIGVAGTGIVEYITDFPGLPVGATADFDLMRRFAEVSGRPLSFTLVEAPAYPGGWREILKLVERANADGVTMRGQVAARAIGISFGLDLSYHPFSFRQSYKEIAHLPLAERVAKMREPVVRARILSEPSEHHNPFITWLAAMTDQMFVLSDPPCYEPRAEERLSRRSEAASLSVEELAYHALLEDNGHAILYLPVANYRTDSLDQVLEMMQHPDTVVALGDGGAHYGLICDASYPSFALTHWVRDRRGERIALPEMVRLLTSAPAEAALLRDRGLLATGYKADINVLDLANMQLGFPEVVYDLPSGGRRMAQPATGYVATLVSGVPVRLAGRRTGAYPGRLIRGLRAAPASPSKKTAERVQ
ncbi:N-acyl-D-amino-acid deacylase family protein [Sphingomonas immobilis]|uniref:Amidohydrolase family protein n=1 Tax=Sphingomonas immobilis TaxID=3063997 RepID=A0ABT9A266_9SPHN|nr:amidohydrolase family protein [Sphingomonas sp. CA1-15]MDO7843924.1 amidohydrolase family protein [Sphingomonas sp. CA1-15]